MSKKVVRIVIVLAIIHLTVGLSIIKNFGISWDEPLQRNHGLVSMDYVNSITGKRFYKENLSEDDFKGYIYKDHGVVFQLTALSIEIGFGITEYSNKYLLRHVLGLLLFVFGAICIFLTSFYINGSWKWAIAAWLFYVLCPRIFAHSFYNPKDTIALSWYAFSLLSFVRYFKTQSFKRLLVLCISLALLITSRIFGMVLIPVFIITLMFSENKLIFKAKHLLFFFVISFAFVIALWPNLWTSTSDKLYYGLKRAAKWHWEGSLLFFGKRVSGTNLPWYYIFGWQSVTIPVLFLILHLVGFFSQVYSFLQELLKNKKLTISYKYIPLMFYAIPLFAIIVKHSVMYDGWRHTYFLYAPMALLMLFGLKKMADSLKSSIYRKVTFAIVGLNFVFISIQMSRLHPHQITYFNVLMTGQNVSDKFELDYWGAGYKDAYKHWLKKGETAKLKLAVYEDSPQYFNYLGLSPEDRSRFNLVLMSRDEVAPRNCYYISHIRTVEDRALIHHPQYEAIDSVMRNGNLIYKVFRRN